MSVYFIRDTASNKIKIGKANDVLKRLRQLQSANANKLEIILTIPGDLDLEKNLHDRFAKSRISGEWFNESDEIINFISGYKLCHERNNSLCFNFDAVEEQTNSVIEQKNTNRFLTAFIDMDIHNKLVDISKERNMYVSELVVAMLSCAIDVYEKCESI